MTEAEIYEGSHGPEPIAEMAYKHVKAALAKLRKESPDRIGEITGLEKRLAYHHPSWRWRSVRRQSSL